MRLQTGDILHCKGKSIISKLIMKFTKGRFSHTAIAVEIWGQIYIVGAQKNGINPRLFKEWKSEFNYDYIVSKPVFNFDKKELSKRIMSKVGHTKYDFISLILWQPLYIITGKWNQRKDKAEKRFYCSEFVGWVYKFQNWNELSPQDLYEYVSKDIFRFYTE